MTIQDIVSVREPTKDDLHFILSSSITSLSKYTESITKGQTKDQAYKTLERIILFALNHMPYSIFIACHKDDSTNIIGYIVADTTTNHIFLQYTKYNYRKLGIQKNLLLPLVVDPSYKHSCNWPTKEMLRLVASNKIEVKNLFVETLITEMMHLRDLWNSV